MSNFYNYCVTSQCRSVYLLYPTVFHKNRFVSLQNLYESCGMHTEKGRSTPPLTVTSPHL